MKEVNRWQGLSKDVGGVISRADAGDDKVTISNMLAEVVIANIDVFCMKVIYLIFRKVDSCIVVTEESHRTRAGDSDTIKEVVTSH